MQGLDVLSADARRGSAAALHEPDPVQRLPFRLPLFTVERQDWRSIAVEREVEHILFEQRVVGACISRGTP
jgi:hypothetical protein